MANGIGTYSSSDDMAYGGNSMNGVESVLTQQILLLESGGAPIEFVAPKTMVTKVNNHYYIKGKVNLKGYTVTLPQNGILEFEKGGLIANGTIVGKDSTIIGQDVYFEDVKIIGTWKCPGNVGWWASPSNLKTFLSATNKDSYDRSARIQRALDSSFRELIFPPCAYYLKNTLVLRKEKKLIFQGSEMFQALSEKKNGSFLSTSENTSILFTCENKPILSISIDNENINTWDKNCVVIEGGNFDVSLCQGYSSNCIEVLADNKQKLWGLTINGTCIKGNPFENEQVNGNFNNDRFKSVGININPKNGKITMNCQYCKTITEYENEKYGEMPSYCSNCWNDGKSSSKQLKNGQTVDCRNYPFTEIPRGYITNVKINARISSFGVAVKAWDQPNNWCSDIVIDGNILFCPQAVISNAQPTDIRACIQTGTFFGYDSSKGSITELEQVDSNGNRKIFNANDKDFRDLAVIELYPTSSGQLEHSICSPIFDFRQVSDYSQNGTIKSRISNAYVLKVPSIDGAITPYGTFLGLYANSKRWAKFSSSIPSIIKWPDVDGGDVYEQSLINPYFYILADKFAPMLCNKTVYSSKSQAEEYVKTKWPYSYAKDGTICLGRYIEDDKIKTVTGVRADGKTIKNYNGILGESYSSTTIVSN